MSQDADLAQKLISLAAKRFDKDVSTLTPQDDFFEKLGIDSFQAMELLTDIEDEFDVEIPDYELQGINTFEGLAGVLATRL